MTSKSFLEKIFGQSGILKIMDVMMTHPSTDYSKKELAEAADVAESTVHRNWQKLEDINAVEKTRKYGKTQLYRLNQDSEIVKQLFQLEQKLRKQNEIQAEAVRA